MSKVMVNVTVNDQPTEVVRKRKKAKGRKFIVPLFDLGSMFYSILYLGSMFNRSYLLIF